MTEQTPVEEVMGLMVAKKIDRVLIIDGEPLGIVSQANIVGAIATGKQVPVHSPVYDL